VLAGLAFVFYVFGDFIIGLIFYTGWISYSPVDSGVDWTQIWQDAARFGIWLVLASVWIYITIRTLKLDPDGTVDES
jgi:hypothetical protein